MSSSDDEPSQKRLKIDLESEDSNDADDPSEGENEKETDSSNEDGTFVNSTNKDNNDRIIDQRSKDNNVNANFLYEELTPDDEILTFQCPKNFDIKSLLGKKLGLSHQTKINQEGQIFACEVIGNLNKMSTFVFPSEKQNTKYLRVPLAGHIIIRKMLKLPFSNQSNLLDYGDENIIPSIDAKSDRHPLLGKDWYKHMHKVRKQLKKNKKHLRKSLKHEESLVMAKEKRKMQKKILKDQISMLKKLKK